VFQPSLIDDENLLADSIAEVLSAEYPLSAIHKHADSKERIDDRLWAQAAELGWLGVGLPEMCGGLGFCLAGLNILFVHIGSSLAPGPFIGTLCAAQVVAGMSSAEVQEVLDGVLRGVVRIAVPAYHRTPLLRDDSAFGNTSLQMIGGEASDFALLPIINTLGVRGLALLKIDGDSARLERQETWDRTRELSLLTVAGKPDVIVIDDRSGMRWTKFETLMLSAIAADSVGGMETIIARTMEYMKQREQFGRPIGSFQALKHRAADLESSLAINRHILKQALSPSADCENSLFWASLAKAANTDAYVHVAEDCIQLHGGIGFTWEHDCHLFLKRARLNQALGGSNTAIRDQAIAYLLRANAAQRSLTEIGPDVR
jgi:alkylation response protein AidB-like acyl-CoA dehydrogenase